jgi:cation:H+ antiporter
MLLSVGLILFGLLLLVAGGEALLRGAVGLATLARLTPAVIGLTVVAAGTSIPELAVCATAAAQGRVDITVGNVVGSNIFNITVIVGLTALICPLTIGGNTVRLEYPVLALVTLMCVAVGDRGSVARLDAILFLAVYVGFTAYLVSLVREQATAAETAQLAEQARELEDDPARRPGFWACAGLIAGGVGLLAGGAHLTVLGAVAVGRALGMSERLIGLTIVSMGTGLPEVVTSVVSAVRGRADVALANVIGSNLFNVLIVLGVTGVIAPLPVADGIAGSDNWWMLGVTLLLLFPIMLTGKQVKRWEGGLLLAVYGVYLAVLLGWPD